MLNLNEVSTSSGNSEPLQLIPDGTVARAYMVFGTDGDTQMPEFSNAHVFRKSQNTSAVWLPLELTIMGGDYDKRKVWTNLFVHGDAVGDDGVPKARRIGLETLRKMIDSAHGLSQNDMSPEAQAKRNIASIDVLDGIEVCVVIGVEKGTNGYADKNRIKTYLTPDSGDFIASGGGTTIKPATTQMPQNVQNSMNAQAPAQGGVTPAWAQQ